MSEGKKEIANGQWVKDIITGQNRVIADMTKLDAMKSIQDAKSYFQDMSEILTPTAFPIAGLDMRNDFGDDAYWRAFQDGMGNNSNELIELGTEDGWSGMPTRFRLKGSNTNSGGSGRTTNQSGEPIEITLDGNLIPRVASELKISNDGIEFLKVEEGFKPLPYQAVEGGKWTIGYGHEIRENESFPNGVSREEAHVILLSDIQIARKASLDQFLKENNIKLNQYQYDALLSFTINMGEYIWDEEQVGSKGESIRKALIEGGRQGYFSSQKMEEVFVLYQSGGLLRDRRLREANLFNEGIYSME